MKNLKKKEEEKKKLSEQYDVEEHTCTVAELSVMLSTELNEQDISKSNGLTDEIVKEKLISDGKNILSPPKKTPEWIKFLLHFTNFFMILLNIAGILSCIAYALDKTQPINLYLGIILFIVVFLTCCLSYFEERTSSNVMKTFSKMLPSKCTVIREGIEMQVMAEGLVTGDLVKVSSGDRIPADLRIVMTRDLKVEASSITGESHPISCTVEMTHENPLETRNLSFSGSLCLSGEAYGIVIRTGDNTLIGSIARMAGQEKKKLTTLQLEVRYFVRFIAAFSFIMAIVFFSIGMGRGQKFLTTFVNGFIVVIVANVPQGLPATVTSLISIAAKKMAKKSVYVKRLDSVETLGSTSLVASDKTGTLTMNKMMLVTVWYDTEFTNVGSHPNPSVLNDLAGDKGFFPMLQCATLCNRAKYDPNKDIILGDASDTAIYNFVNMLEPTKSIRDIQKKVFEIPFNSVNKYSIAIAEDPTPEGEMRHTLFMKGAPEIILGKCSHYMHKGESKLIDDVFLESFSVAMRRCGLSGERVLGLACARIPSPSSLYSEEAGNFPTEGLTLLGFVSLMDPPRPNVPEAVKTLKEAGIKVFMVTGDHPLTAESIARQVNIIASGKTREEIAFQRKVPIDEVPLTDPEVQAVVVPGYELNKFTNEDWNVVLSKKEVVFARTTPIQKLQIVERNQALGHVVAVTGDGVNDSPALKAADVGVSMGIMGSDVAREAADIILITDDFAAIVDAVRIGRVIFDNLKKTIAYTLTHLIPEVAPVLCSLAFSLPLGLSSILILFIDLGTELGPAISIAYEKAENKIMKRPPRNIKVDRLVSKALLGYSYLIAGVIETLACFLGFFIVFITENIPISSLPFTYETYWKETSPDFVVGDRVITGPEQLLIMNRAQTAWFTTLVMSQFWHVWLIRSRRSSLLKHRVFNRTMVLGCIVSVCILLLLIYVPFLNEYLYTGPLRGIDWVAHLAFLIVMLPLTELIKYLARHRESTSPFIKNYIAW